jgi:CRISPR/Cas system CSM-associated protein Csm3 (group 7 of RAMP superfamily)
MVKLKGDPFENRYRLVGVLESLTPLHIGSGLVREEPSSTPGEHGDSPGTVQVSEICVDYSNKPIIPGSAIRGNIRHYLLHVFHPISSSIAKEFEELEDIDQGQQIQYMRTQASMLELLLGTPFAEGKVEFWDAPLINRTIQMPPGYERAGWNPDRCTYVVKSVAIDPITGTAAARKLYTFEVAPAGLKYELNVVGQNLDAEELGLLLFALEAINSEIYPLTFGAMSGRGFGRMKFSAKAIYKLGKEDLNDWIKQSVEKSHAGYYALKEIKDYQKLINGFKNAFSKLVGGSS